MSHLKSEESTCYNCVNSKWAQKYEKAVFKTKPTNFGQGGVEAPEANISFQGMMKNVICSSSVPSHWEGPFTNGLQEFSTTRHAKRRGFRGPQQLVEHETLNLKESCFSIIQLKQVVFSVINHQIAPIIEAVLKSPDEWQTRLLSHLASHPIRGTRVRQRTYVTKVIEIISDFMQQ
ncbi:hypothetical protein Pelo_4809 [Pelomyxa schiedti]|nr:hypothetical protein Pelo_4809 [Pelomyxa schiedti]